MPHPRCWGEPVDSLRTKQLTTTIIRDGYDSIKANGNLVAVEENPRLQGYFQSNFRFLVAFDPDMEDFEGNAQKFGSLSNSSLNCLMNNILCCCKGCILIIRSFTISPAIADKSEGEPQMTPLLSYNKPPN